MCHGVCAIVCVRRCVRACACVYASSAAERLGSLNNGHICFLHTTSYSTRRQGRAVNCPRWCGRGSEPLNPKSLSLSPIVRGSATMLRLSLVRLGLYLAFLSSHNRCTPPPPLTKCSSQAPHRLTFRWSHTQFLSLEV